MSIEAEKKKLKFNIILYGMGLVGGIILFTYILLGLTIPGYYPGWWGAGAIVFDFFLFLGIIVIFAYIHESITQYIEL